MTNWFLRLVRRSGQPSALGPGSPSTANGVSGPPNPTSVGPTADNPIRDSQSDVLGRAPLARRFAQQLMSLDATEGSVVGVLGPWGSGKTSFVNLARADLEAAGATVLDYNPWMFSGAEQLVDSFFLELSAQLGLRPELAEIGKSLEEYGEAFSGFSLWPLLGPWVERGRATTKLLARILQRRKQGYSGRRVRLVTALAALTRPIVVILDDIDRLSTGEIRDVFRLVRLTASFPNVIYVVAFDRLRVEQALGEQGIPGRDYLEKILQVAVDLPAVPEAALDRQVFMAIEHAISGVDSPGQFDADIWSDVYMEIIRPLIGNMRDVRRYAAAVHGTVRDLAGEVALPDVLALEAIRVFLPDVFRRLHESVISLTGTSERAYGRQADSASKAQIDRLVEAGGDDAEVVRDLIQRLFPAAQRHSGGMHYGSDSKAEWLRRRRVAHSDVLRMYLERVVGEELQAFTDAERAWLLMADDAAFDSYLRSLGNERLQDVIGSLEVFEGQFAPEHVIPGGVVLLNLLEDLPDRDRGMFDLGPGVVVRRVVYRLLRSLGDTDAIERATRAMLPRVRTLSAKAQLVTIVGYREDAGHKLISEAAASELEASWRGEIRSAPPSLLAQERHLLRILLLAKEGASSAAEPSIEVPDSADVTLALLRSARSDMRAQAMGSRAVRRSPRLAWDRLLEVVGHEDLLQERISRLKAMQPEDADELLALVDRYSSGWRPGDFDDG